MLQLPVSCHKFWTKFKQVCLYTGFVLIYLGLWFITPAIVLVTAIGTFTNWVKNYLSAGERIYLLVFWWLVALWLWVVYFWTIFLDAWLALGRLKNHERQPMTIIGRRIEQIYQIVDN